jgi:serine/threonine protein kinase
MGYMAPEILDDDKEEKTYNSSCDLYSLGVIAYNLIVGCLPFRVEVEGMYDRKIVWDAFEKPEAVGLHKEILKFLSGLLEKDPSKRLTPSQALSSRFFTDSEVIESWRTFNKNRIEETYSRVFKVRNN